MLLSVFACKSRKDMEKDTLPMAQSDTVVVIEPVTPVERPTEKSEVIYYERSSCFGTCPSFIFTVDSEGQCNFKGRNFVDMIGDYKGTVAEEQVNAIRLQALTLGYDTLQGRYDNRMVSDLPSTITSIDGKRVVNRYNGPNLNLLYNSLDTLIVKVVWEGLKDNQK
ncbi:MAG: hypothetical protein ACJAU0_000880 [Flavobacteriales bacterium]|jgi:hypothetical protein